MALFTTLLLLAAALAIPGLIARTRARLAGRRGIRFAQHLYDARLLLRKGAVYSTTTSALFRTAPSVYLGAALVAALFIPVGDLRPVLSFDGDLVAFAYTLALGRFVLILAAMDTGSPFEGMGASREALYGALVEPGLLLATATLALVSGYTSFARIFAADATGDIQLAVVLLLTAYVFVRILFTESGRVPVDDPRTHLELTMIHEVMCLDYAGVDLAMIKIAGWLKSAALAMLAADAVAAPLGGRWWIAAPLSVVMAGIPIGVVESTQARNKLVRNTTFILIIAAMAALVFFAAYLLRHNIIVLE
ncbi:MAG: NADH-quinone oxidoreductase subunit H [Alistipes sp.]|nr:NADH-quinone oxidoreductase subunit H [Alistipes sp.]